MARRTARYEISHSFGYLPTPIVFNCTTSAIGRDRCGRDLNAVRFSRIYSYGVHSKSTFFPFGTANSLNTVNSSNRSISVRSGSVKVTAKGEIERDRKTSRPRRRYSGTFACKNSKTDFTSYAPFVHRRGQTAGNRETMFPTDVGTLKRTCECCSKSFFFTVQTTPKCLRHRRRRDPQEALCTRLYITFHSPTVGKIGFFFFSGSSRGIPV